MTRLQHLCLACASTFLFSTLPSSDGLEARDQHPHTGKATGERRPTVTITEENGPCDISWLLTPEASRLTVPPALQQISRRVSARDRWKIPDLRTLAAKTPGIATSPVERSGKVLVVMVEYDDLGFASGPETPTATHADWRRRILGLTPGPDGSPRYDLTVESLVDFWNEASFGRVTYSPVVETFDAQAAEMAGIYAPDALPGDGIVHVKLDMDLYQLGYYWPLQPAAEYSYISAALRAASQYVNFQVLDTNLDGTVDRAELAILLVFANPNQEEKGDWVWPHRFALPPNSLKLDGVVVASGDPTINPTVHGGSYLAIDQYRPDRTIHHEFGHDLGLPDLYNVTVTGDRHNDGIGYWGVMASSEGMPEGWSRMQLGWLSEAEGTLQRFSGPGAWTLSLPSSSNGQLSTGMVTVIERPGTGGHEYFLLENRRWEGKYERYLPGEGLLIYHVLDNQLLYRISATNLGTGRKVMGLKVIEADGAWNLMNPDDGNKGDDGDPYLPGDRFAPDANPSSSWYGGQNSQIYLENLRFQDINGTLEADLCIGPGCEE